MPILEPLSHQTDDSATIEVPGGIEVLQGSFARSGDDLCVTCRDGSEVQVDGYFAGDAAADLVTGGAVIPAKMVKALTRPEPGGADELAGGDGSDSLIGDDGQVDHLAALRQHGQGGDTATSSEPVAEIGEFEGVVTITRADGSRVTAELGTPVYQDDVIATGAEGSVGVSFVDGMSFSLGQNAKLLLDEFSYEPQSGDGGGLLSVLQGGFSFVSGEAAHSGLDALMIETPTMTIGVRGTKVAAQAGAEGEVSKIALMAEQDGTIGKIMVSTDAGQELLEEPNKMVEVTSRFEPPSPQTTISTAELVETFGVSLSALPAIEIHDLPPTPDDPDYVPNDHGGNDHGRQNTPERPAAERAEAAVADATGETDAPGEGDAQSEAAAEEAGEADAGEATAEAAPDDSVAARLAQAESGEVQETIDTEALLGERLEAVEETGEARAETIDSAVQASGATTADSVDLPAAAAPRAQEATTAAAASASPSAGDSGAGAGSGGGSTPAPTNQAPTVATPVGAQGATEDSPFSLDVTSHFSDPDAGDVLTYSATLSGGGALPGWLSIDPTTGVLSGTALNGDVGALSIDVTATDGGGLSTATTFALTVSNTNDAPVLDTAGAPALTAIAEDTAAPAGDTVAAIVIDGSVTDVDGAVAEAIAVTSVDDTNGTWEYSTDGGTTFNAIGAVSDNSALLLDGAAVVRFVPNADFHGGASFDYKAWDQSSGSSGQSGVDTTVGTAFSAASDSASVAVTSVADAPVLDTAGAPTLTSVLENTAAPVGDTVAAIVVDGSVTDVDGPVAEAVAVTSVDDTNGTWEYSTDGGTTFNAIGAVSDSSALLLDGAAVIRFVPNASYNGTASFDYKAWDQSSGTNGQSGVDTTVGAAFSTASETAAITVTAVNAAPVLDNAGTPSLSAVVEDSTAPAGDTVASIVVDGSITDTDGARESIAVTSIDNTNGTWEYSTGGGTTFNAIGAVSDGSALLLDSAAVVRFVPTANYNGTATFGYKAWDESTGSNGQSGVDTTVGNAFSVASETAAITVVPESNTPDLTSGTEFQVNSTTSSDQAAPGIADLDGGGYVVVWQSEGQDGSNSGVFGQRYDADGGAVGIEFQINTTNSNNQDEPAVTGLDGGGFVVVWTSMNQDGHNTGVFAQRYDASGDAVGVEFQVNTETTNQQENPDITALNGGGFVVTWESQNQDGGATGVYGQRYDASGNAAGSEFLINSTTTSQQYNSQVTALNGGGFVVVWQSSGQDSDGLGVFAQRYDAAGAAVGSEFQVNSEETNDQSAPDVAALADGGFVVVWQSTDQDGSGTGVFGQRYDASGNAVEFEFPINKTTANEQEAPSVTALDDGGFLVAWQAIAQDGDNLGIIGQRYNADGDAIGGEFQVNSTGTDAQTDVDLATLDSGSVVATWQSANQDGNGAGVYAHQFDSATASVTVNAPVEAGANVMDFGGSTGYVDAGQSNGDLDPGTADFTVEAWFHYDGASGTQTIVSKGGTISSDEGYRIFIDDGTLVVRSSTATFGGETETAASQINLGGAGWYHVAMVVDQEAGANASSLTGYLNGVSTGWTAGQGATADNLFTTSGDGIDGSESFLIGADDLIGVKTDHFDSQIGDVRVWNTARSQTEIQADMSRTLNGDEDHLVANWTLDNSNAGATSNTVTGGVDGSVVGSLTLDSTTSLSTAMNTAVQSRVTATDLEGDTLSFSVSGAAANGNAVIDASTGAWEYTPDTSYTGTDSFSYQISDGNGGTDTVSISVQVS